MISRPVSFVSGMLPIRGFKNCFLFLGLTLAQKKKKEKKRKRNWPLLIDIPFNDGFWSKISIFFQLKKIRDEAES